MRQKEPCTRTALRRTWGMMGHEGAEILSHQVCGSNRIKGAGVRRCRLPWEVRLMECIVYFVAKEIERAALEYG